MDAKTALARLAEFQSTQEALIDSDTAILARLYNRALDEVATELAELLANSQGSGEDSTSLIAQANRTVARFDLAPRVWERFEETLDQLASEIDDLSDLYGRNWAVNAVDRGFIDVLKGQFPRLDENGGLVPGSGMAGQTYNLTNFHKQELANAITRNVVADASRADVIRSLEETTGRSTRQASQLFQDGSLQFARTVQAENSKGFEYFVSMGPVDGITRRFCGLLVNKVWTREEINRMNNGQDSVSVFVTHGGYNCRHHWQAVESEWFSPEEWTEQRGIFVVSLETGGK
jgi:hypothetical protein